MPGTNPIGYLDSNPIIIHAIPDEIAVANNTPVVGIPVLDNSIGFIPKMYAMAKKVVMPPIISVLIVVPFSCNLKKFSTYFFPQ